MPAYVREFLTSRSKIRARCHMLIRGQIFITGLISQLGGGMRNRRRGFRLAQSVFAMGR